MGFFNIFKKSTRIKDEFFGTLIFMEIKDNPANNYFEGKGLFNPTQIDTYGNGLASSKRIRLG